MSKIEALMRDLSQATGIEYPSRSHDQSDPPAVSNVLRIPTTLDEPSSDLPTTRSAPAEDWSHLVEQVRMTAARLREVEADAEEQELRVQDLLQKVREDMQAAADRVQAAEAHARDIQSRTEALLKAADQRVKAAEERAQVAEGWLKVIKKTFAEEFEDGASKKRSA